MKKTVLDGGEAIAQALRDLGIDYVFSSPGSEWAPVWEAFSRQKVTKTVGPEFFNTSHEMLAVDLAIGYTLITGRMQAVLLHAGSGLLHGSMGISSALASEIPMVVISGECVSFGDDDNYDPGAQWYAYLGVVGGAQRLMEPHVKWSNQAASPSNLHPMVIRAGEIAQRTPAGPAYLCVPVESLVHPWKPPKKHRLVAPAPITLAPAPDVAKLAKLLLEAKNPVITTESVGRDRESYDRLIQLAELLAIPVVESSVATVSNFPKEHPLHQGYNLKPLLADADLVLVVRSRVPWYPPKARPANATVVVIDEAPFKSHMVYQNFQADFYLEGDVVTTLGGLVDAVRDAERDEALDTGRDAPRKSSESKRSLHARAALIKARFAKWAAVHQRAEAANLVEIAKARKSEVIQPINLCVTLGEVLPLDTIYVDETTSHRGLIHRFVRYQGQFSFIRTPSGLGQSLGLALGVKLASPERPVVVLVGDGAFHYNPVVPALGFAQRAGLPILIVVFNNKGYRSMGNNQRNDYPEGAGAKHNLLYGSMISVADYEQLAKPFGGIGIRVEDPAKLKSALRAGWAAVKKGKTAIINVVLGNS
ncbi:MAG: thiamine pyrophosphate-binding protein [Burkholderiales bacterium]